MIQIAKYAGADALTLVGPVGVLGGLLLVAAGISVLVAERPAEALPVEATALT